jgi:hypothetical protein
MSKIALCLDHRVTTEDGIKLPSVTGKHYVHAEGRELQEKREVLQAWANELRRIIGLPAAEPKLKLVACLMSRHWRPAPSPGFKSSDGSGLFFDLVRKYSETV